MRKSVQLSIIIAALDEAANLERLFPLLYKELDFMHGDFEIIVVNGASTDGTGDVALKYGARMEQQHLPGYGGALRDGFAASRGTAIMTMDADLSHPPVFIKCMLNALQDAEMVVASRYVNGGSAEMPAYRRILSRTLNLFFEKGLALPIKDVSSGFRLYRAEVLNGLSLQQSDFSILEEILVKAITRRYRIVEVPFHYAARGQGHSKARIWKFGISYLRLFPRLWRERHFHCGR